MIVAHVSLPIIRPRAFAALSVLSLVLCLAAVTLWVRSELAHDWFYKVRSINRGDGTTEQISYSVRWCNGGVVLERHASRGRDVTNKNVAISHDSDQTTSRS